MKNKKSKIKDKKLLEVLVEGKEVCLRFDDVKTRMDLKEKPILLGIKKVVSNLQDIGGIKVYFKSASFSITRQVVVAINTLAWQLNIKVNGKKQISAEYSGEPNITV